ncbi:MAG: M20/M25/M40 family metallo-hydrolase [Bacteroidales bacterium]|nr:M20/M25/M40 family metallo-hydrolase [Bacteroidales bacterium]
MMDIRFYMDMLGIDSTSGRERGLADFLAESMMTDRNTLRRFDVESMRADTPKGCEVPQNLFFSWGTPKVIFCSHLDTVPPYIAPHIDGSMATGRGTCDAKGQIFAMWEACKAMEDMGMTDFGLLLLAGEETGSFGAKAFNSVISTPSSVISSEVEISPDAWVIVGEPTDNCMATAEKGTKSYDVTFSGKSCHSGYPELGASAIMYFNDFVNALRSIVFPVDEVLGETTWNIGDLVSANPQNILSDRLTCRIYFRTTFESDEMVRNIMKNIAGPDARLRFGRPAVQDGSDIVAKSVAPWQEAMSVNLRGGDAPTRFEVLDGFPVKAVAFGSDAPVLKCFRHRILCGPGSIHVAHRPDEHINIEDIETAVRNYIKMAQRILEQ